MDSTDERAQRGPFMSDSDPGQTTARTVPILKPPVIQTSAPSPGDPMEVTAPVSALIGPPARTSLDSKTNSVHNQMVMRDQPHSGSLAGPNAAAAAAAGAQQPKVVQTGFIHKLYNMLEDQSIQHLISWSNSAESFVMSPSNDFSKVLSRYFKHLNISSFVRQLNMYGFHKVSDVFHTGSPESPLWEFKHGNGKFKRGDFVGLREIKRLASRRALVHRDSYSAPKPPLSKPGTLAEPMHSIQDSTNLTSTRNLGRLSAPSESQSGETTLRSANIGSFHSVLENDLQIPPAESIERPELLSNSLNMPSADPQLSPRSDCLEDSLDSDMFSISDSSDDVELLDSQESVYPILNNILHELLAGFRTATQYQLSPGESGGNPGPVPSTAEPSQPGANLRPSQKRSLLPDEEDDTGEDGSRLPPLKRIKSSQSKKPPKSFACPFLKWGPTTYSRCCVKKLTSISYVKQHLIRNHTPERYCQVCQAANFPDDDSLERHINIGHCTRRDRTMLDGVSYQQRSRLSRKSTPNASKDDQWFAIWDILFIGHRRPNSVYMDTDLTQEMLQLHEYFASRGPAIIREHLESDPAWRGFGDTEKQGEVYLERLIAQGFKTWFEDWFSNGASASTSAQHLASARQSQYETPTNSIVDSGVAMGDQSASLGSAGGDQVWNLGYHGSEFETGPQATFDFDFDALLESEDTSSYFPQPGQDYLNGGPSAETDGYL